MRTRMQGLKRYIVTRSDVVKAESQERRSKFWGGVPSSQGPADLSFYIICLDDRGPLCLMVWYCFVHLRHVQACSSDVLLSHMCRNQKCCDKLCHFGACTHVNDFSYNEDTLEVESIFLSISRDTKNYEKVAQMYRNNEQNKIFIRKNCIFEMGKYCTVFEIQP